MLTNRHRIIEFSSQHRLLLASSFGPWAREGALLSYGPDTDASTQRAVAYVDKDLTRRETERTSYRTTNEINGKIAKSPRLHIPPTLLATADEVIK